MLELDGHCETRCATSGFGGAPGGVSVLVSGWEAQVVTVETHRFSVGAFIRLLEVGTFCLTRVGCAGCNIDGETGDGSLSIYTCIRWAASTGGTSGAWVHGTAAADALPDGSTPTSPAYGASSSPRYDADLSAHHFQHRGPATLSI